MKTIKMSQCKYCNSEIAPNAGTCPNCGAVLKRNHGCFKVALIIMGVPVFLIALLLVILLNSCSVKKTDNKATIETNSGETVEMTSYDIRDIYNSNKALFDKEYSGAKISFEGTVSKVNTGFYYGNNSQTLYDEIEIEESSLWNVVFLHDTYSNLHELEVGDVIYVESYIWTEYDVFSSDTHIEIVSKNHETTK